MRIFWLIITVLLMMGCQNAKAPEEIPVGVSVSQSGEDWIVEYQLVHPVNALIFPRSDDRPRSETWTMESPGTIKRINGFDAIIPQEASAYFRLKITPGFHITQHDYSPFIKFEDGGVALFTGQFEVLPVQSESTIGALKPDLSNYEGTGLNIPLGISGDTDIFIDGYSVGRTYSINEWERGTYLYIGADRFEQSPDFIALIDTALPVWAKESIAEQVEIVMEAQREIWALPQDDKRFTILFAFGGYEGDGLYLKGGSIGDNLLVFDIRGSDLNSPTDLTPKLIARLIAHETTHMFQSRSGGTDLASSNAWISEGHAEAMAYHLLFRRGLMNQNDIDKYYRRAVSRCSGFLADGPLRTASERGQNRAHYECGNLIWVSFVSRAKDQSLAEIWKAYVSGREDAVDQLIGRLDADGNGEALQNHLREILNAQEELSHRDIVQFMEGAGIRMVKDEDGKLRHIYLPEP